jgi:hypothetical protein
MLALAKDFNDFLKLLNSNGVEYLLIGGYAVALHGYIRATNDLDVWVGVDKQNSIRVDRALREFGFAPASLSPDLFQESNRVIRMGMPPLRIEVLTSISGVDFGVCYQERETVQIGELRVPVISLTRLRQNKSAAGRAKDRADLESLPG